MGSYTGHFEIFKQVVLKMFLTDFVYAVTCDCLGYWPFAEIWTNFCMENSKFWFAFVLLLWSGLMTFC